MRKIAVFLLGLALLLSGCEVLSPEAASQQGFLGVSSKADPVATPTPRKDVITTFEECLVADAEQIQQTLGGDQKFWSFNGGVWTYSRPGERTTLRNPGFGTLTANGRVINKGDTVVTDRAEFACGQKTGGVPSPTPVPSFTPVPKPATPVPFVPTPKPSTDFRVVACPTDDQMQESLQLKSPGIKAVFTGGGIPWEGCSWVIQAVGIGSFDLNLTADWQGTVTRESDDVVAAYYGPVSIRVKGATIRFRPFYVNSDNRWVNDPCELLRREDDFGHNRTPAYHTVSGNIPCSSFAHQ